MSKPPTLRPSGDLNTDVFARETRASAKALSTSPFSNGKVIGPVQVAATPTPIAHGLGRRFSRWTLVDITGLVVVMRVASAAEDPSKYIVLQATAPVTVTIYVE